MSCSPQLTAEIFLRLPLVTGGSLWPELVIEPHQIVGELKSVSFHMLKTVLCNFL